MATSSYQYIGVRGKGAVFAMTGPKLLREAMEKEFGPLAVGENARVEWTYDESGNHSEETIKTKILAMKRACGGLFYDPPDSKEEKVWIKNNSIWYRQISGDVADADTGENIQRAKFMAPDGLIFDLAQENVDGSHSYHHQNFAIRVHAPEH